MANNNMPNKTASGTNVQQVRQQNAQSAAGNFGTEFASETAAGRLGTAGAAGAAGAFGTEFGSETNAQHVRQQNQKAESNKSQNS